MSNVHRKMTKGWKFFQSLWLLFAFVPFGLLAYICFFFIGVRTRKVKWITAGFIYMGVILLSFFGFNELYEKHFMDDYLLIITLIAWLACMVHAAWARQEYLKIIFERQTKHNRRIHQEKEKLARELQQLRGDSSPETSSDAGASVEASYTTNDSESGTPYDAHTHHSRLNTRDVHTSSSQAKAPIEAHTPPKPRVININRATENEISALPGIHRFLAKSIVQERTEQQSFASLEQLAEAIDVDTHVLDEAEAYIVFSDEDIQAKTIQLEKQKDKGRTGRLVDY